MTLRIGIGHGTLSIPPAETITTVGLTAVRLDGGSGPVLVSSGIPLQEGQLASTDIDKVSLWLNTGSGLAEVSCYTEVLASRPTTTMDGSVWSVLIQWTGNPDSIIAAEIRLSQTYSKTRNSKTTPPGEPAAMLIPTSAVHLRDCDIFPYPITLASDIHSDFSGLPALFSDAFYYGIMNDGTTSDRTYGKYARAQACFLWIYMNGPAVANAANWLIRGNGTATRMYVDNPYGDGTEYGALDCAGNAIHYLFTGYAGSWTRVGQYACRWGYGSSWDVQRGGRGIFHAAEAMMYAYLLDIDDVTYTGIPAGPYTRAQHMSNLVTKVTAWDGGWSSGGTSLPTPVEGFHNVDGNATAYGKGATTSYMNAMMHTAVMRCFIRLAGESSGLDALRAAWETALLNFCDVILNDADGYDDTAGVNVWVYALYMDDGTTNIRWASGSWGSNGTAQAGTDTNTIHCDGLFTDATAGDVVYNQTRNDYDTIASVTSNDEAELTGTITGQTTGDTIIVEDDASADQSYPGTYPVGFWSTGFTTTAFGYAKDAAEGAQATEFSTAFRAAALGLISRYAAPGTSNTWGYADNGGGTGYYQSGTSVDAVGINGIVGMGLAHTSPWLDEAS